LKDSGGGATLEEVLESVKQNNKEIKIADFDIKIKEYENAIAEGYRYGKLDFSETYSKTDHPGYVFGMKMASRDTKFIDFGFDQFLSQMPGLLNPQTASSTSEAILNTVPNKLNYPDPRENYETKFSYQLPIFTGGKLEGYRDITKKLVLLYSTNKDKVIGEKVAEAKKTFYDTLLLEDMIKDLEKIQKSVLRLELSVEEYIKEGYANKIDLLEIKAKKAEVEEMLIKALANKELSMAFISFLAGQDIYSIKGSFEELQARDYDIKSVVEGNHDIKMAQIGSSIAKSNISVEKSSLFPTLGGFAEGGWNDDKFGDFDDKGYYLFGVQAKINIFNGGIDSASYQKAKIGYLKAKEQEEFAKSAIELKTKQLLTELKGIGARIETLKSRHSLDEEIFENYQERYVQKLVSMNDLLIKESLMLESMMKLYEVQNQKNAKLFELDKISGLEGR